MLRGACRRQGAAGPEVTSVAPLRNRSVAIDAIELDGRARLGVEFSAAVAVLLEMAIDALHSFFQVNILKVRGLLKFLRIVRRDRDSLFVEQVALAVARKHGAEEPAVAVKIGELRRLSISD